jgi:pyruvate/2-oxoacid:ferredoxin oxidoreductase beta subunit
MAMSLGALTTVNAVDPPNLTIVVWNNAGYATTGGQDSASDTVAFDRAAERLHDG